MVFPFAYHSVSKKPSHFQRKKEQVWTINEAWGRAKIGAWYSPSVTLNHGCESRLFQLGSCRELGKWFWPQSISCQKKEPNRKKTMVPVPSIRSCHLRSNVDMVTVPLDDSGSLGSVGRHFVGSRRELVVSVPYRISFLLIITFRSEDMFTPLKVCGCIFLATISKMKKQEPERLLNDLVRQFMIPFQDSFPIVLNSCSNQKPVRENPYVNQITMMSFPRANQNVRCFPFVQIINPCPNQKLTVHKDPASKMCAPQFSSEILIQIHIWQHQLRQQMSTVKFLKIEYWGQIAACCTSSSSTNDLKKCTQNAFPIAITDVSNTDVCTYCCVMLAM